MKKFFPQRASPGPERRRARTGVHPQAGDEPGAPRAFARGQEFPADGAARGEGGIRPPFPGQIRLIDNDGSRLPFHDGSLFLQRRA